jgi:uncharacterized membrane protein
MEIWDKILTVWVAGGAVVGLLAGAIIRKGIGALIGLVVGGAIGGILAFVVF